MMRPGRRRFSVPELLVAAALLLLADVGAAQDRLSGAEHAAWRAIGRVNIAGYRTRTMCTGTLIAPDLVLTAAHCVINERTGRPHRPGNVRFAAGWFQGKAFTHAAAVDMAFLEPPATERGRQQIFETDIALLRLGRPLEIRGLNPIPVAGLGASTESLSLISYRGDRPHVLTRQDGCPIRRRTDRMLVLDCNVTFGASGGPLLVNTEAGPRVVAVVSAMGRSRSGATTTLAVRAIRPLKALRTVLDRRS